MLLSHLRRWRLLAVAMFVLVPTLSGCLPGGGTTIPGPRNNPSLIPIVSYPGADQAAWYYQNDPFHPGYPSEPGPIPSQPGVDWVRLRVCESGRNYLNTNGDHFGAYQFDNKTWRGVIAGYESFYNAARRSVDPNWVNVIWDTARDAPYWAQDWGAQTLYSQRGKQPWSCGF